MEKKYEMIPEGSMFRVKALRDFGDVKKGDIGGLIESELNLSHDGKSWVYDNARIYGSSMVYDDAQISDNAVIYGNAQVYGNAIVYGNVRVYDSANVYGNSVISGKAQVYNDAKVYGKARIYGDVLVYNDAKIYEEARVYGAAVICGNAEVCSGADYIVFKNWWSSGRYFTWTRSNDMWKVGCFFGSGEELIKKAYSDSEEKGKQYEKIVKYVESIKAD